MKRCDIENPTKQRDETTCATRIFFKPVTIALPRLIAMPPTMTTWGKFFWYFLDEIFVVG